jgi:23S rRNA pseudouridine2605 synthase
VKVLRRGPKSTLVRVTLREGRNREIRRLMLKLGHKVRRLKRVAIGPITDRGLRVGAYRPLRAKEVQQLRQAGRS